MNELIVVVYVLTLIGFIAALINVSVKNGRWARTMKKIDETVEQEDDQRPAGHSFKLGEVCRFKQLERR